KTEQLDGGRTRCTYPSGLVQVLNENDRGMQVFPDGRKHCGVFDTYSWRLKSGYAIPSAGKETFVDPAPLVKMFYQRKWHCVVEFEDRLVVLIKTGNKQFDLTDMDPFTVLLSVSQKVHPTFRTGHKISKVLEHPAFQKDFPRFMDS